MENVQSHVQGSKGSPCLEHACPCKLCADNIASRRNLYCKDCKKEIDACKKDAEVNDWTDKFELLSEAAPSFRAMMQAYSEACPSRGRGKKRAKFDVRLLPSALNGQPSAARPRSEAQGRIIRSEAQGWIISGAEVEASH